MVAAAAAPGSEIVRENLHFTCGLVLMRHGESEWNARNLFTGWANPLSPRRANATRSGLVTC